MTPESPYTQRWRDGQHSWRHKSEGGFDSAKYEIALIDRDNPVKDFVLQHHYSGSFPSAKIRVGLYERSELVGVAILGSGTSRKALTNSFPQLTPYQESLELSRFVLLDAVPANAETWFLARVFALAAERGVRGVVSFADPVQRSTTDGRIVCPGHVGTIYQAANGLFAAERSTPRTLIVGPDARVLSARTMQKIRKQEQGARYSESLLVEWGAAPRRHDEDPTEWLNHSLGRIDVRRVRHPGNYRYLFRVGRTRAERSRVVIGMSGAPYPKAIVPAQRSLTL